MEYMASIQLKSSKNTSRSSKRQGRKPGKTACSACHAGKKRCDIAQPHTQCMNCRKGNQVCLPRDPVKRYVWHIEISYWKEIVFRDKKLTRLPLIDLTINIPKMIAAATSRIKYWTYLYHKVLTTKFRDGVHFIRAIPKFADYCLPWEKTIAT